MTVAAAVAGLALLYGLFAGRDGADIELGEPGQQRGYYLSDATLTETGADGRPRFVVHARTIEQRLSDQGVELDDLALDYRTRDFGLWHATAREGFMPADRQSLQLSGDVTVTGAQSHSQAVIRTERLGYDIAHGVVQTDDPVAVRFGEHVLNARGLRAELNAGTLQLESNVHGRFVP